MAEPQTTTDESKKPADTKGRGKTLVWLILLVVIIGASAGGGLFLGRMLAAPPKDAPAAEPGGHNEESASEKGEGGGNEEYAYCDLEPIIVSLNEPRMDRYIRATITVAVKNANAKAVGELLARKKPELKNWMTIFLAGCTLDQVRGDKGLSRLRTEILDSINRLLWPDSKPLIDQVLFKEFAVQ